MILDAGLVDTGIMWVLSTVIGMKTTRPVPSGDVRGVATALVMMRR